MPISRNRIIPEMPLEDVIAAFTNDELSFDEADNCIWAWARNVREWGVYHTKLNDAWKRKVRTDKAAYNAAVAGA